MSPEARRRALRAAAAVAAISLAGCGPRKTAAAPGPETAAAEQPAATEAGESPSDFATCEAEIASAVAAAGERKPLGEDARDCCETMEKHYSGVMLDDPGALQKWETRGECCDLLEWRGEGMACTPWGPPTPPAMA
ncbi:MAG: hypothetical protein EP330_27655 [Deltaproteobacteria bacterium]|nr:MAG: hypothetical protein EP330_27655 [Deltaproteobacteria bacterium]